MSTRTALLFFVLQLFFSPALVAQGQKQEFVEGPEFSDAKDFLQWGLKIKCQEVPFVIEFCDDIRGDLGSWWSKTHKNRRMLVTIREMFGGISVRVFLTVPNTIPTGVKGITIGSFSFTEIERVIMPKADKQELLKKIQAALLRKSASRIPPRSHGSPAVFFITKKPPCGGNMHC